MKASKALLDVAESTIQEPLAPGEVRNIPALWRPHGLEMAKVSEVNKGAALMDGMTNLANNMGQFGKDSVASTTWQFQAPMDYATLQQLYRFDGIARRYIEITTKEMTRRGFTVKGDKDGEIVKYLKARGFMKQTPLALRWGLLYGGAIGVILCDDQQRIKPNGRYNLALPLREDKLQALYGMNVFDRWRVTYTLDDLYTDPSHPKYMWPRRYWVFPIGVGEPFVVHESRVVRIDGAPIPEIDRQANNYWMDSELQSLIKSIFSLMSVYGYTESIITDFVQGILTIDGLNDMVASGNDEVILKKMRVFRLFKGITNTFPVDKTEEYTKVTSTVSGLSDLMDQFWALLQACSGYPQIIWQGRSPTGLNGDGGKELQMFDENIQGKKIDKLEPWWHRIAFLACKCAKGPTSGQVPEGLEIEFPPNSVPSEQEAAEVEKTQAETDKIRVEAGIITEEEARTRLDLGSNTVKLKPGWKPPKPVGETQPGTEGGAPGKPAKKKPVGAAE